MGSQHGANGVLLRAARVVAVLALVLSLSTPGAWGATAEPSPTPTAATETAASDPSPTSSETVTEPPPDPPPESASPSVAAPATPSSAVQSPSSTPTVTASSSPSTAAAPISPATVEGPTSPATVEASTSPATGGEPTSTVAAVSPTTVTAPVSPATVEGPISSATVEGPASPLVEESAAGGAAGGAVVATVEAPARPGPVEDAISAYVEEIVRSAVIDVRGRAAACFCAVSVAVSLDGPTNAVAALGRVNVSASGEPSGARSGRSGDATAVSVTGGGSASAAATSGSTGTVGGGTGAGTTASSGVGGLATTIDVAAVTSSLQRMVREIGDQMAAAAGAGTEDHVAGLLAGTHDLGPDVPRELTVEVATWDRAAGIRGDEDGAVRCEAYDGSSTTPSCALAVAVTADSGAHATVLPPRLPTDGSTSAGSAGAPGMATAVSVAVSGAAVSSARTGDAGVRVPRAAVLADGPVATGDSASSATSGSSGRSVAVALTVRGASATSARSGDTGAALSYVLPASAGTAGATTGTTGATSSAVPGSGGTGTAGATSGDSGDAWALVSARSGASGESLSGDTGDAIAGAADGSAGTDWSEPGTGGPAGRVSGGAGGDAQATSGSGSTGTSLALVISGGSAVATATSGLTGSSSATATGGRGGDTHVVGEGTQVVRTGDGGRGTGDAQSGRTGDATVVLVTEYDVSAASRTGSSGAVDATARGGDAGCASSGIDPDRACKPPPAPASPAQPAVTVPHGALPLTAAQPGFAALAATDEPAGTGAARDPRPARTHDKPATKRKPARDSSPEPDQAEVVVRSSDSADVVCTAHAESRVCRSPDTPAAGDVVSPAPTTPAQRLLGLVTDSPAGRLLATGSVPAALAGSPVDDSAPVSTGEALLPLLLNAALPVLALLSLTAMFMNRRRKLAAPPHIPKHRRKQPLPTNRSSRHR